jgi:hypothetical protein
VSGYLKALSRLGTFKYHGCMSEDKNMISDEAVEAAAMAFFGTLALSKWEDLGSLTRAAYRSKARAALEAAAPHMLAEAWDEGHEDGFWNGRLSHGDTEALTGIEHAKATNPYRSQT